MKEVNETIRDIIKEFGEKLRKELGENLQGVILYGSWVKGKADENLDIDLLVVVREARRDLRRRVYEVARKLTSDKEISVVIASEEEFRKERLPLFTAVKKEGIIVQGNVDFRIDPSPPGEKYRDFFFKSREFEGRKIEVAEKFLKDGLSSGVAINCYIASKHIFQVGLAMKGVGFSSKFPVLARWVEENYGKEWREKFRKLFDFYIKSEYELEELTEEEASLAVSYAKEILERVYQDKDGKISAGG